MVKTVYLKHYRFTRQIWNTIWVKSLDLFSGAVSTVLHGYKVLLNYGYTYPLIIRQHPTYNAPLIELIYSVFNLQKAGVAVVDVGAAIGDTMLCLLSNCSEMINNFCCIDGDTEFFRYLEYNLGEHPNGKLVCALLSSQVGQEKNLVKIHRGTASAQGTNTIPSTTFDALVQGDLMDTIDLIKLDADGFDGRILAGSVATLNTYKPAIFFEWHPIICEQVNNDWHEHFEVLANCGYEKFVWFDNYGGFSHFMHGYDTKSVELLAWLLKKQEVPHVAYYDVIALHKESQISLEILAELKNAGKRKSWT